MEGQTEYKHEDSEGDPYFSFSFASFDSSEIRFLKFWFHLKGLILFDGALTFLLGGGVGLVDADGVVEGSITPIAIFLISEVLIFFL